MFFERGLILQTQQGMTLFEVMIALSMSIIFCMSLYQIVYACKHYWQQQQATADLLENGIFLQHYFEQKLQRFMSLSCLESHRLEVIPYQQLSSRWRRQVKTKTAVLQLGECDEQGFRAVRYFVAKTNRANAASKMLYALYQKKIGGRREEILPGIVGLSVSVFSKALADNNWHKQLKQAPDVVKLDVVLDQATQTASKPVHWPLVFAC